MRKFLSSVLRFSLIVGFENSLVGICPTIQPGRAPAEWLSRYRCHPRLGGGGADDPTWRTDDDPGTASTRAVGHRDRAADGARPQDRAQIRRARHRGAGLRPTLGGPPQQARPLHGIFARADDRLPRSQRDAADPRGSRARLRRRLYRGEALPGRDPTRERPEALRGALGAPSAPPAPGRLRGLWGRLRRRSRHQPGRLAVQPGAWSLPLSVRALRSPPGFTDALALSYPGLRGAGRGADRDPLRPHEDRGDWRGRSRPYRLQPLAARAGAALSLSASRLPTLSGEDQGEGRAAVQLYPPGLVSRPQLPQPRRPQRPAHRLARYRCQRPRTRHHPAGRRRGFRGRTAR